MEDRYVMVFETCSSSYFTTPDRPRFYGIARIPRGKAPGP